MFNIDTFLNSVGFFVTSYKNDLVIDRDEFVNNTPFIHIARATGTRMLTREAFVNVADKVIANPYGTSKVIFSNVPNNELLGVCLKNTIATLEYDWQQKTDILIHYYDGKTLVKFDDITALYAVVENWKMSAQYKIANHQLTRIVTHG